jgi:hypothetical protein
MHNFQDLNNLRNIIRLWLVSLMPAMQDAVAVEGVGVGVGSPNEMNRSLPCKGGEVGACKDLKGNVFTIGSGNKGKDGDMLCTSKEKLTLYIGTNYGDDACQE